jgi:Fe-S oxidoreductase
VGKNIDKNGTFVADDKNLNSYISEEELWACTTCQACVQICPVNINPMEIIVEMRRFKVMEQSQAPQELNQMFTNVENNGAPWQMAQSARFDWAAE